MRLFLKEEKGMLKNLYKTNNRIASFLVAFIIIVLLFSATKERAYSLDWRELPVIGWIADKVDEKVSTMADEMLSGIGQRITAAIETIAGDLVSEMSSNLGPDISTFEEVLSGKDIGSGEITEKGVTSAAKFTDVAQVFGYGLAMFIFLFSLMQYFWSKPGDLKDTPLRLVLKLLFAFILITSSRNIMDTILDAANTVWKEFIMTSVVYGETTTIDYSHITVTTADDNFSLFGGVLFAGLVASNPPIAAFIGLIALFISWPLIKGFVKLYIEIIERYLVVVLLYFFFGAAAATVVSNNSVNVFKSYMRMVASQIFILFTNAVFMSVLVDMIISGGFRRSIPNYIFVLAYMKVCQRIDSYMAMLGLNVAQTGGQTLDAILGAGRALTNGARGLNRAREGVANLASANALKNGNFTEAAKWKAASGVRGMADVMSHGGIEEAGRFMAAQAGRQNATSTGESAQLINDFINDPTNTKKASQLQTIDKGSLINGLNKIMQDSGQDIKVTDIDTTALRGGRLKFDGISGSGENAQKITGNLSSSKTPNADNTRVGSGYLSTNNKLKESPDTVFKGDAKTLGHASGYSELINNEKSQDFKDQIAGMKYNSKTGNSDILDKDGNQIGTIANIGGKDTLVKSSAKNKMTENTAFGKKYKELNDGKVKTNYKTAEAINSKISKDANLKDLKWGKVENGIAHGTAITTDDFGKEHKVEVLGKDVGTHGTSKKGTICKVGNSSYIDIQTRPISESTNQTAAGRHSEKSDKSRGGNENEDAKPEQRQRPIGKDSDESDSSPNASSSYRNNDSDRTEFSGERPVGKDTESPDTAPSGYENSSRDESPINADKRPVGEDVETSRATPSGDRNNDRYETPTNPRRRPIGKDAEKGRKNPVKSPQNN